MGANRLSWFAWPLLGRPGILHHQRVILSEPQRSDTYSENRLDDEIRSAEPDWITEVDRGRLIVFTHVPKTGGTTLKQILTINYGRHFADHHPRIQNLKTQIEQGSRDPSELLAMSSHLPYGIHRDIPGLEGRQVLPMTVVREPKGRLISYFNFVTTFKRHRLYQEAKDMDINEFFEKAIAEGAAEISNGQCRVVGGKGRTFDAAREVLEGEYFAYSALEHLNELVEEIGVALSWPEPVQGERKANQSPRKRTWDDLEPNVAALLEESNAEDLALHEYLVTQGPVVRTEKINA